MVEVAHKAGFPEVSERTISYWVSLGLLPKASQVGRGPKAGSGARYEWSDAHVRAFLNMLGRQRDVKHLAMLAPIPVSSWLYWGDDFIQLPQVRRALATWWARTNKLGAQHAQKMAESVTKALTPRGTPRGVRADFKSVISNAVFNETFARKEIIDSLAELRVDDPRAGLYGSLGVPEYLIVDQMFSMRVAMERLVGTKRQRGKPVGISDDMFDDARRQINLSGWHYLQNWAIMREQTEHRDAFEPPSFELFINKACGSLLSALGMRILAEERGESVSRTPQVPYLGSSTAFAGLPLETRTKVSDST